uniref:Uncharacterized protein n=1 Tax=Anguilla anguilla TaxID=7936 RepID=A0A0E9PJQ8_ANGAN
MFLVFFLFLIFICSHIFLVYYPEC